MNPFIVWLLALVVAVTACTTTEPGGSTTSTTLDGSTVPPGTTAPPGTTPPGSTTTTTRPRPVVPVPVYIDENGFNDHTVPAIDTTPEFFALARGGFSAQWVTKFTITEMTDNPRISWMDSNFYSLHDEWYWFRLLNGAEVPGSGERPQGGPQFAAIADIYTWADAQPDGTLPYDLRFVGGQTVGDRLYSDRFYQLALDLEPRRFGLGSLVYYPTSAGDRGERWVLELEYHDDATPADIARFFTMVESTVPAEIGDALEWVIRSPEQESVARRMEDERLPYHDRIVRFSDLVEPGVVTVYNEGITAGRLLLIGEVGQDITSAITTDILLVENVPDWLPPGKALISSSPQTPLSHVNLLARNRGMPNASQTGILDDPGIRQAARVRAPAVVRVSRQRGLEIVLITEEEYARWRTLGGRAAVEVPGIDPATTPTTVDLDSITGILDEGDIARWRPVIGGKAAGFLNLLAVRSVALPDDPIAITVKPYLAHLARVESDLTAMLADRSFVNSRRTRFLMLEGPEAYRLRYTQPDDQRFLDEFTLDNAGTSIERIINAGGFVEYLRDVPMDAATLGEIVEDLARTFPDLDDTQGLRFRSSSTVEDIEGFNGAGLYDSNTGFLDPAAQADPDDRKKTIEWAIKKTWASYWSFEAFEERRNEAVDHRSGGMAVLVHPRFDDAFEKGNGVFVFTILPGGDVTMVVNVQDGITPVANPDPATLPEQAVVSRRGTGTAVIERVAASNLVAPGIQVLSDAQLLDLFAQGEAVTRLWMARVNAALPTEQRVSTLTLDFEYKEMAPGWGGGTPSAQQMVLKQARTLEPSLRGVPEDVLDLPIPRDVLARARLITRNSCGFSGQWIEVFTDQLRPPDMGYSDLPLIIGSPGDRDGCTSTVLHTTPEQFLLTLLATGRLLNLTP